MKIPPALWTHHARHWDHVRPPLRPFAQDLMWAQQTVDQAAAAKDRFTALILGVTPELCDLQWPASTCLLAVDSSLAMIQKQAAVHRPLPPFATLGEWTHLPLANASCDLVIGDGCFVLLHSDGPADLIQSVRRVLKPGGQFHIRVFIRPAISESPDAVWHDLQRGRIGNFHIFKFRLLASLCNAQSEVKVAQAYQYFSDHCPDVRGLATQLHWPVEEIKTIDAYCDQPATYWYPTAAEFRKKFDDRFKEAACRWPEYEMGDRCPTFVLTCR